MKRHYNICAFDDNIIVYEYQGVSYVVRLSTYLYGLVVLRACSKTYLTTLFL